MNYLPIKLVKMRKHYNYSQGKLAEVLGVDTLEYMGYENGRLIINHEQIKKLASFYHVSFEDIFRNDDQIKLEEVKENTDELNIEYFIPNYNIFQKILRYIRRHPIRITAISLILILSGTMIFLFDKQIRDLPFEIIRSSSNYLSASNTSIIYIDEDGNVKGNGDNTNGQLNDLPNGDIAKVDEGNSFSVFLDERGKLSTRGLTKNIADEVESWNNIISFAVGNNHIIAVDNRGRTYCAGDNSFDQCRLNDFNNIKKVFASPNGSVGISKDDRLISTGEVFGASIIKNIEGIVDIDFSNDNTVVLKDDKTVSYYAKNKSFVEVDSWRDIIGVACGDNFIAGLNEDGKVLISTEDQLIKREINLWQNIKSIAAGNDYIVAYDGEKIYGAGENTYNQYERSANYLVTLPQVSDVKINNENNNVVVTFKGVENAKGYLVSTDAGIGHSIYVVSDQAVTFDSFIFENDKTYTFLIITIGEGDYENSSPASFTFEYHRESDGSGENSFIIDSLIGKTKNNFEAYFRGLNYDNNRLQAIEADVICNSEEPIVLSVSGIYEGESLTYDDLQSREISYTYCKIGE